MPPPPPPSIYYRIERFVEASSLLKKLTLRRSTIELKAVVFSTLLPILIIIGRSTIELKVHSLYFLFHHLTSTGRSTIELKDYTPASGLYFGVNLGSIYYRIESVSPWFEKLENGMLGRSTIELKGLFLNLHGSSSSLPVPSIYYRIERSDIDADREAVARVDLL